MNWNLRRRSWRFIVVLTALALSGAGAVLAQNRPSTRPNVVLIAVDTLRADDLGCYGYPRPTSPCIDKLAGEGVLFERACSPASWTLPAFASLFSGVGPAAHGCGGFRDPIPLTLPLLSETLRKEGYRCDAVISNPFLNAKYGFGRGFDEYDDYSVFLDEELAALGTDGSPKSIPISDLVTGATVTRRAKQLLAAAASSGRPYFLFVHYFDPHASYIPSEEYRSRFEASYDGPVTGRGLDSQKTALLPARDLEQLRRLYDGEIAHDDAQIGELLKAVDAVSDPQQTLIIFLSDHGESFSEHGRCLHGNSAHMEETHVPLIWRWKGRFPAAHRAQEPVSSLDVFATLCDLLELPRPALTQGQSLRRQLEGGQGPQDRVVVSERACNDSGAGQMKHLAGLRGGLRVHLRFVENPAEPGAQIEAYDVASDPLEQRLLEPLPPTAADVAGQISEYWRHCRQIAAGHRVAPGSVNVHLSEAELRQMEGLGYTATPATQPTTRAADAAKELQP